MTTTYAVKGTARTAEGDAPKIYTSKNGTKEEALGMLAELQDVQQSAGIELDARIVPIDAATHATARLQELIARLNLGALFVLDADGQFTGCTGPFLSVLACDDAACVCHLSVEDVLRVCQHHSRRAYVRTHVIATTKPCGQPGCDWCRTP